MANRLIDPYLNSIKFFETNPAVFYQYAKKPFDYSSFQEQIFNFQEKKKYCQKRSIYDNDFFQFESNYDPITLLIINEDGDAVLPFSAQNIVRNKYQPDYFIYEVDVDYGALAPGYYYFKMVAGVTSPKLFESEPFEILPTIENTVLLEYSNSTYFGDVLWETGISMSLRVEGVISSLNPSSKDNIYEDQSLNLTMLSSFPFETWKLFIGTSEGIPDYVIKRINRILSCDNVKINGKYYSKFDGSKWEKHEEDNYPMSGWTIELRESLQRNSNIYDSAVPDGLGLLVVYNIEGKMFGDMSDNAGSNVISVISVE